LEKISHQYYQSKKNILQAVRPSEKKTTVNTVVGAKKISTNHQTTPLEK